jgi:septum formation protein
MSCSILLASSSPRRRDLLRAHGYEVRVQAAQIEEVTPEFLTVGEITLLNARRKARDVALTAPDELVLAADTLVALDGHIFGKPRDMDEAFEMLSRLNGRVHEVFSGVWLARGKAERGFVEMSRVHFHRLSAEQLHRYLVRIGPLDKAGAYAAQDQSGEVIASVDGSLTNVIGLPMEALADALRAF